MSTSKELKILIFKINEETYATDIMGVERILTYEEPTKVPDSPSFIEGVTNHEGKILPIVSISKRFGLVEKETTKDTKIIVSKQADSKYGIIVDMVSEVKDINTETLEEPPEIVGGISKKYLKGLIKTDNQIIILVDLEKILSEEERAML